MTVEPHEIAETIRHWQHRGVTSTMAWRALGHSERSTAGWAEVRAYMLRWALDNPGGEAVKSR